MVLELATVLYSTCGGLEYTQAGSGNRILRFEVFRDLNFYVYIYMYVDLVRFSSHSPLHSLTLSLSLS